MTTAQKRYSLSKNQMLLLQDNGVFPTTRFQGSKLKILDWIWEHVKDLKFNTALDAFGGTGSVGYLLKSKGKQVIYNDILKFNWYIGLALIENDGTILSDQETNWLQERHSEISYPAFIKDTFKDIYYTDEENEWLDVVVTNILQIDNIYKKAIAFFALFQACIIKRPFNLFHRKNLYIRFSEVERNFGNKATWDTPFPIHFKRFIFQANQAVFSNGLQHRATNKDVLGLDEHFDLVYVDTPYISGKGVGVDYFHFYHFLEGLANYNEWQLLIDHESRHKKLKSRASAWSNKNQIHQAFDQIFKKFEKSIIVVSYRIDGIPSVDELIKLLRIYKNDVSVETRSYKYVLSNNCSEEVLIIAK